MFNGYRMKINGVVFNDSYVHKGSYSAVRKKRVITRWTDANLTEYELDAPTKKAIIKFELREHSSSEHADIIALLQEDDYIHINYYADDIDDYVDGIFRREDITFNHKNVVGGEIIYERAAVTFTEH